MDKIVLDLDLKFVCAQLSLIQKGELLSALFEGHYRGGDEAVSNIFFYINGLQKKQALQKQKMHDMSLRAAAARKAREKDNELSLELPLEPKDDHKDNLMDDRRDNLKDDHEDNLKDDRKDELPLDKRKEAKENFNNINKNNFLFSPNVFEKNRANSVFVPPTLEEARAYIEENHLSADAETFINFYESHGWMVGSTPIKSWQATLKLWHGKEYVSKYTYLSGSVISRSLPWIVVMSVGVKLVP